MIQCARCLQYKADYEFYGRSGGGYRSWCKECIKKDARLKRMSKKLPKEFPPTELSWLTPLQRYVPDPCRSDLEHPWYVREVIVDPNYTAEDDEQSSD